MIEKLVYYDLFLIRYICEPILHRLQRWNGRDNFWWFKKVLDVFHGILFVYSLFLIMSTQFVSLGIFICCWTIVMAGILSFSLRSMLAKKSLQHQNTKHPIEIKIQYIRRGVLRGERNPLEELIVRQRILLWVDVVLMAGVSTMFFFDREILVLSITVTIWAMVMLMGIYIFSCTPLPPQSVFKKNNALIKRCAG